MGVLSRLFLALALTCPVLGCNPAPKPAQIKIAGSTALAPLLKEAGARYAKAHPGVTVDVAGGGSKAGIAKVATGEVTLGASDIFAQGAEAKTLIDNRVAVVAFATMANRGAFNEAIGSLTRSEVKDIFMGKISNWSQLGGGDQAMVVINRTKGSGTRIAFGVLALGGDLFVTGREEESSKKIQELLETTPGAISYLALSYAKEGIKTFAYDGVAPVEANVTYNFYPLWSYEHLYSNGPAPEQITDFISFLTSGKFQREVLPSLGFIPLNDMRVVRDQPEMAVAEK